MAECGWISIAWVMLIDLDAPTREYRSGLKKQADIAADCPRVRWDNVHAESITAALIA